MSDQTNQPPTDAAEPADHPPVRRRWVYTQGGQPLERPVEVGGDWTGAERGGIKRSEEEVYGHLVATDGTRIDTRRRHREYMKANGLTLAEDYKGQWAQAEQERARAFTDPAYDRPRRLEAVKRAFEKTSRKRGR